MFLNCAWLLVGLTGSATLHSLALTSDHLGTVLPQLSFVLSVLILLIGSRAGGLDFLRDMVIPLELGVFYLMCQPLPGMAVLPLLVGFWFGLSNRLLDRPVTGLAFLGQSYLIVSAGLLFWRHLGLYPGWTLAGMLCYGFLSNRPSGRRVLV